jgi:threonine/homoserine/homoserine lactone efflux protein
MSLTLFIPSAFPALVLAHFLALLSPGPDFFLVTAHSLRHRLRGSGFICLGIALGNGVYIVLAITCWSVLRNYPFIFRGIEVVGGLYLLWLGGMLLRSQPESLNLKKGAGEPHTYGAQFLMGAASALLNPKNALFYLSLMTVILGAEVTLLQQISCGMWMFLAVLGWDLLVAMLVSQRSVQRLLGQGIYQVERLSGAVLAGFGGWILYELI